MEVRDLERSLENLLRRECLRVKRSVKILKDALGCLASYSSSVQALVNVQNFETF